MIVLFILNTPSTDLQLYCSTRLTAFPRRGSSSSVNVTYASVSVIAEFSRRPFTLVADNNGRDRIQPTHISISRDSRRIRSVELFGDIRHDWWHQRKGKLPPRGSVCDQEGLPHHCRSDNRCRAFMWGPFGQRRRSFGRCHCDVEFSKWAAHSCFISHCTAETNRTVCRVSFSRQVTYDVYCKWNISNS